MLFLPVSFKRKVSVRARGSFIHFYQAHINGQLRNNSLGQITIIRKGKKKWLKFNCKHKQVQCKNPDESYSNPRFTHPLPFFTYHFALHTTKDINIFTNLQILIYSYFKALLLHSSNLLCSEIQINIWLKLHTCHYQLVPDRMKRHLFCSIYIL